MKAKSENQTPRYAVKVTVFDTHDRRGGMKIVASFDAIAVNSKAMARRIARSLTAHADDEREYWEGR